MLRVAPKLVLFLTAACIPSMPLHAQAAPAPTAASAAPPAKAAPARRVPPGANEPLEQGEGRAVALKLADELVASFVIPRNAEDYAAMLRRNAAAGRYDKGTRGELAKLMTDDLQAVHRTAICT